MRSAIFVSLQPGGCHGVNVLLLVRWISSTPQKNGFRPESPAIAFGTLRYRRSAAVESRSAGRKKSKKIFELEDETVGTAFACDYGLALHENSRASATRASFYLRRTTRRRSSSAPRPTPRPPEPAPPRRFSAPPGAGVVVVVGWGGWLGGRAS